MRLLTTVCLLIVCAVSHAQSVSIGCQVGGTGGKYPSINAFGQTRSGVPNGTVSIVYNAASIGFGGRISYWVGATCGSVKTLTATVVGQWFPNTKNLALHAPAICHITFRQTVSAGATVSDANWRVVNARDPNVVYIQQTGWLKQANGSFAMSVK